MTRTRVAVTTLAIMVGALGIASATHFTIESRRSAELRHTMTCLAAYVAFIRVMSSSEQEAIKWLMACEKSQFGEEPIHLDSREHPFLVEKYDGCVAAQLLLSTDLEKSLEEQQTDNASRGPRS